MFANMIHPLKEWLAHQSPRRTVVSLAADVGVHAITLRRLLNAEDSVQRDLFEKIEKATGGELTAVDLYAHYLAQRAAGEGGDEPEMAGRGEQAR